VPEGGAKKKTENKNRFQLSHFQIYAFALVAVTILRTWLGLVRVAICLKAQILPALILIHRKSSGCLILGIRIGMNISCCQKTGLRD